MKRYDQISSNSFKTFNIMFRTNKNLNSKLNLKKSSKELSFSTSSDAIAKERKRNKLGFTDPYIFASQYVDLLY